MKNFKKYLNKVLKGEKGVALMMVMWVMVFIGIIASEFASSMKTELQITRNYKEEVEAKALAEAGVSLAYAELLREYDYTVLSTNEEVLFVKDSLYIDSSDEFKGPERKSISFGSGTINYSIIDEKRKIGINNASRDVWIKLLEYAGVEMGSERDTLIDSIEDWKDADDLHRMNGAEDDYYMSLPTPYHCKNGPFETIDELLLVKGMTPEIYEKINKYLTPYNVGGLNLNTASEEVLRIIYDETRAEEIINKREENGGVYDKSQKGSIFTIKATGIVDTISRTIVLVCNKQGNKDKSVISVKYWNDDYIGS